MSSKNLHNKNEHVIKVLERFFYASQSCTTENFLNIEYTINFSLTIRSGNLFDPRLKQNYYLSKCSVKSILTYVRVKKEVSIFHWKQFPTFFCDREKVEPNGKSFALLLWAPHQSWP